MIKCPKCSFEQPEDIYCANCGVNMKTFRPSPVPFMKAFIGSWMGKVFLITLAIIGALVYDLQKTKNRPQSLASGPAQSSSAKPARDMEPLNGENQDPQPAAPAPEPTSVAGGAASKVQKMAGSTTNPTPSANEKSVAPPGASGMNVLRVSFYSASRSLIQDMQRESVASPSSGEAVGGIIPLRKLTSVATDLKSLASNRYKLQDGQKPIIIYKGQRTADVKAGIYFQISPLRHEGSTLQLEVKSWGNIKPQESDETYFTSEMTINPQNAAFVAGFLPRDKALSEEEKTLLEGDATLKIYNQDDFADGSADLIMVIEMVPSP